MGKPDGDVRIWLDPSELKKAIQRQCCASASRSRYFNEAGTCRRIECFLCLIWSLIESTVRCACSLVPWFRVENTYSSLSTVFVIDFPQRTAVRHSQHFVVPTMNQLFAKIGKSKYFCSSDVASGFYQIPLIEERRSTKKSCPNCLGIFPML
jgi:hypothetical protein